MKKELAQTPPTHPKGAKSLISDAYPIVQQKEVVVVQFQQFQTTTPSVTAQAILNNLSENRFPENLISVNAYLGNDHKSIFLYWQWRDELQAEQQLILDKIKQDLSLATGKINNAFYLYRSIGESKEIPGCIVLAYQEFENPTVIKHWIDTVVEAVLSDEPKKDTGGLSGHFHISTDNTSMLNYAEWRSAAAHQAVLDNANNGTIGSSEAWKKVAEINGLKGRGTAERYTFYKSISQGHW